MRFTYASSTSSLTFTLSLYSLYSVKSLNIWLFSAPSYGCIGLNLCKQQDMMKGKHRDIFYVLFATLKFTHQSSFYEKPGAFMIEGWMDDSFSFTNIWTAHVQYCYYIWGLVIYQHLMCGWSSCKLNRKTAFPAFPEISCSFPCNVIHRLQLASQYLQLPRFQNKALNLTDRAIIIMNDFHWLSCWWSMLW